MCAQRKNSLWVGPVRRALHKTVTFSRGRSYSLWGWPLDWRHRRCPRASGASEEPCQRGRPPCSATGAHTLPSPWACCHHHLAPSLAIWVDLLTPASPSPSHSHPLRPVGSLSPGSGQGNAVSCQEPRKYWHGHESSASPGCRDGQKGSDPTGVSHAHTLRGFAGDFRYAV